MKRIFFVTFVVSLVLLVSGCDELIPTANYPHGESWHRIDDYVSFIDWEYEKDNQVEVIKIFRLDPEGFETSMKYSSENPKYVSEWNEYIEDADIIINGAYFHEDYSPSGYLKIDYNRI